MVQQERSGPLQPGVAPVDAPTERQAADVATQLFSERGQSHRCGEELHHIPFANQFWELHRQPKVIHKGTSAFHGEVGPGLGSVDIRHDEKVLVNKDDIKSAVTAQAIEFRGTGAGNDFHWLQFTWIEAYMTQEDDKTFLLNGPFSTSAGVLNFTQDSHNPAWVVDVVPNPMSIPWYDQNALAITESNTMTIFDTPAADMSSYAQSALGQYPDTKSFTFRAHFATCLMRAQPDGVHQAVYCVPWAGAVTYPRSNDKMQAEQPVASDRPGHP